MADPQTILVPKASLPGGVDAWIIQSIIHLRDVLSKVGGQISALLQNVDQDQDNNVILAFSDTLSEADNASVLALCQRANDYFALFADGVLVDIGSNDPAAQPSVSKPCGPQSSSTIQLQLKDGNKNNIAADGVGAVLKIEPQGYMTIADLLTGGSISNPTFDGTGQYSFTTGVEITRRGSVPLFIFCGTLPERTVNIAFS